MTLQATLASPTRPEPAAADARTPAAGIDVAQFIRGTHEMLREQMPWYLRFFGLPSVPADPGHGVGRPP